MLHIEIDKAAEKAAWKRPRRVAEIANAKGKLNPPSWTRHRPVVEQEEAPGRQGGGVAQITAQLEKLT
jgi:hypothetical protein